MKCPACQSINFEEFDHDGIVFDFCTDCKGIWADKGELAHYVSTINDTPTKNINFSEEDLTKMDCPKCNTKTLYEMPYLKGEDLLIDVCANCYGIWMDSKELGTIQKLARNIDSNKKVKRTIDRLKEKGFVFTGQDGEEI